MEKYMSTVIAQNTITSKDGTVIAYSQVGQGPALILVDGALCYRQFGLSRSGCEAFSAFYRHHL
jgi:hypothetical protein